MILHVPFVAIAHAAFNPALQNRESPIDLRLRIVWGGSADASYHVVLRVDQGQMQCEQQLGIDPYDAGFIDANASDRLEVVDKNTRFGGCDLRVTGNRHSKLDVHLVVDADTQNSDTVRQWSWTLAELIDQTKTEKIENSDHRISISRVPGDMLRVITSRPHLVYSSHEPIALNIEPHALPWHSTSAIFDYAIVDTKSGHESSRHSQSITLDELGNAPAISLLDSAPQDDGIYEVRCKVTPKRLLPGILISYPSFERSVQFIVYNQMLNESPRSIPMSAEISCWTPIDQKAAIAWRVQSQVEKLIEQIDAPKRFPLLDTSRWASLGKMFGPKQSTNPVVRTANDGFAIPSAAAGSATVHGLIPNRIHRVSIRTHGKASQFKTSIWSESQSKKGSTKSILVNDVFESDATRVLHQILQQGPTLHGEVQELLIWPRTELAEIELINLSASEPLYVDELSIQVLQSEYRDHKKDSLDRCPTLEYHSSSIRGVFGIPGPANVYDDWHTFLNFAESIAIFAKEHGFRRLAMVIDSQGGSLYPSQYISGNARFDTGAFFADGKDPIRKDVVELMYRVLGRRGIEFVPMLELSGPLRELENTVSRQTEIYQRKLNNPSIGSNDLACGKYNPLSPQVQRAIIHCLEEFDTRFRSNPNYAGFAIRFHEASHLTLSVQPNDASQSLLDQFYKDTNGSLQSSLLQRDRIAGPQAQAMFQHWWRQSVSSMLAKSKVPPRWISTDSDWLLSENSVPIIVPTLAGRRQGSLSVVSQILRQWNVQSPDSLHVAYSKPSQHVDHALSVLAETMEVVRGAKFHSVPHRGSANSISQVRIWKLEDTLPSLIISNANAVAETIVMRSSMDLYSCFIQSSFSGITENISREEWITQLSKNEWQLTIPPTSCLRFEADRNSTTEHHDAEPILDYWFAKDAITMQRLQTGASLLENAANRMSILRPQEGLIANAGFENSSEHRRGNWDGWATSLDPNAQVSIDTSIAHHGNACARLSLNLPTSVAWLQSDPFPVAVSDRFTLTAQIASSEVPERASITVLRYDPKTDRFERLVTREVAMELKSRAQPGWQAFRIDVALNQGSRIHEPSSYSIQLFRVQIEAGGKGFLLVDDIHASNCYMSDEERHALRSDLFLAKGSIQAGDYAPVSKILASTRSDWIMMGTDIRDDFGETEKSRPISYDTTPRSTPSESKSTTLQSREPKQARRIRSMIWPTKR